MTTLVKLTPLGAIDGSPSEIGRRRRRLSAVVARQNVGRRVLVFRVPRGSTLDQERDVVPLSRWQHTLVGAGDTIIILPLVAGGGRQGAGKAASIGLAVAAIALAIIAPYAAPLIASGLGISLSAGQAIFGAVSAGLLIGGSIALQSILRTKANTPKTLYGVSGGGNQPRLFDRRQVSYGQTWIEPDLAQGDYSYYDGDDVVLIKRLALGEGKYAVDTIRVGDSTFWTSTDGIVAPFNFNVDPATGAAVEFLYGQPSAILPGSVVSSTSVTGLGIARAGANPNHTGPFQVSGAGVNVTKIQLDFQYPAGVFARRSSGTLVATPVGLLFEYRAIDSSGAPVGAGTWTTLHHETGSLNTQSAYRVTRIKTVPAGRYEVRVQNESGGASAVTDDAQWDGLRGLLDDTVSRDGRTEIVMRVRSGKSLSVTNFSNVLVRATRILPVWNGSAWIEQPTREARWAFVDILKANYGAGLTDADIDIAAVAGLTLAQDNTFDGTIRGPVSIWEACGTVLHPIRSDVVKVGRFYSMVRDQAKTVRRHVITRRQIIKQSSSITFDLGTDKSAGDVIGTFLYDGDPKRPMSVQSTIPGMESRTPRRMELTGVTVPAHAKRLVDWHAAVSAYRSVTREVTTEYDGRLYKPGDLALVDTWFYSAQQAAQVEGANGNTLMLDGAPDIASFPYLMLRDREGLEFGPVAVTAGGSPNSIVLNALDLAAAQTQSGKTLSQVLATGSQDMSTGLFGTLTELQKSYLVKSGVPDGERNVRITLVTDDPRVWSYIGSSVPTYTPPSAPLPDFPFYVALNARGVQHTSSLEVQWALQPAAPGYSNEVDLSYDGGSTWEQIYQGAAVNGAAPIRYIDAGAVQLRARPTSASGTIGAYSASVTFLTPAPAVPGQYVIPQSIGWPQLNAAFAEEAILVRALEDGSGEEAAMISATARHFEAQHAEAVSGSASATFDSRIILLSDGVTAQAGQISVLQATAGDLSARVSTTEVAISSLGDNSSALSERIDEVEAIAQAGAANGEVRFTAVSSPQGAAAAWDLELSAQAIGGGYVTAGMRVQVESGGGSQIVLSADDLLVRSAAGDFTPFAVSGGEIVLNGVTRVGQSIRSLATVGSPAVPVMEIDFVNGSIIISDAS